MKYTLSLLLSCTLSLLTFAVPLAPGQQPTRARAGLLRHERAVGGSYIVVLKDDVAAAEVSAVAEQLTGLHGGKVAATYRHALKGFSVQLNEKAAEALSRNPRVAYVEEDAVVELASTTQTNAPWGLDRIDQRALPLSNTYTYANSGAGAHVYVIDSGIRTTHDEFGGRASVAFDNVGDGQNGEDCFGHGTQVAGVVGGATYGVAKGAELHAVRVFSCTNTSTVTKVIGGIDFVTSDHLSPAVAVLSVSTGGSTSLDTAVENSIAAGVTYVVAAGNINVDAGTRSPARVADAVTVGATDSTDTRASFSNYGPALDLFAPGVDIPTANWFSDSSTITQSGTSLAAAHTAGVAARYLSGNPSDTPSDVSQALIASATTGHVINPGTDSPNLLLYRPQGKIAFDQYTGRDSSVFVMNTDGSGVAQLTTENDYNIRWSPDGSKISFISQRDGNEEIYVMNADGTNQTRLTNNAARDAEQAWSPDGTKLAFISSRDGNQEVYVVALSGGALTRITNDASYEMTPEWSPDGSKLAFVSGRSGNAKVWTANANGTNQAQLTTGASSDYNPKWAPNGSKLAYTSNGGYEIGVINADGTNQHTATSSNDWWSQFPVWAPDSNRIAFTSHCPYGCSPAVYSDEVFAVNADGTNLARLTNNSAAEGDHAWTPDGTKITFTSWRDGNGEVYVMNADGTGQTNLTNNSAGESGGTTSPAGDKIAFTSDRNSLGNEVFSMRPDGTGVKMLSDSALDDSSPVWAPDGTKIAYLSQLTNGTHEIYVMKSDGTGQTRLTNNSADDFHQAWSPDATKLAFESRRDGNYEIYVMNADGTGQTRLTNNSGGDFSPSWSPNGAKIYFVSNRTGNFDLYSMNADGRGVVNLTNTAAEESWYNLSPDGSKIAVTTRDGDGIPYDIYVMNSDGSNSVNLTPNSAGDYGARWSPDGSKILFVSYRVDSEEIWVMNADGTNQTRLTNNSSDDFGPEWSPDGLKILTYSESPEGPFEIYVMDPDGGNRTRLTNSPSSSGGTGLAFWQPL